MREAIHDRPGPQRDAGSALVLNFPLGRNVVWSPGHTKSALVQKDGDLPAIRWPVDAALLGLGMIASLKATQSSPRRSVA